MRRSTLVVVSLLTCVSGCSRLGSTAEARREIPLSTPVVRITPAHPSASDDLSVVIVEASVDPAGGEVSYEFAWHVTGEARGATQNVSRTLTSAGETWTVEVTPYVGERRGEPARASVVIGAPAAITAPTIRIEPAEPKTLDDLRVIVDTASTDLEGGEVVYDYAWEVDGLPALTGTVVPHGLTTKGETWRVRVCPRVGSRIGTCAELEVAIHNSPPVVGTVGLSAYLPLTIDTLTARPGLVSDADGDAVTFSYAWRRNVSITLTDQHGAMLDLGAHGFARDDSVGVTVIPSDAEDDGTPAELEGIRVHAPRTGWRAVTPNRMPSGGPPLTTRSNLVELAVGYDARNHRLIHLQPEDPWIVWEIPLDGPRRFARLRPEGPSPSKSTMHVQVIADPARERLLVYEAGHLRALELARGNERWVDLPGGGASEQHAPMYRTPVLFDEARRRLIRVMHDGALEGSSVDDDTDWQPLATATALPDRAGTSWLHEPGSDVAYLVGGLERTETEPAGWTEPSVDVVRLDLVTGAWQTLAASMPHAAIWATTATDPLRRLGYVIEGASEAAAGIGDYDGTPYDYATVLAYQARVLVFDFATETFTAVSEGPGPVPPRAFGAAFWDPGAERVMATVGYHDRYRSDLVIIGPDGARTTYDAMGHETPPPFDDPSPIRRADGSVLVLDRSDTYEQPVETAWTFDPDTATFRRHALVPDAVHGFPIVGWGGVFGTEGVGPSPHAVFMLAVDLENDLLDAWRLDTQLWSWHRDAVDVVPLAGNVRVLPSSSSSGHAYVFGLTYDPMSRLRAFRATADDLAEELLTNPSQAPSFAARVFVTPPPHDAIFAIDREDGALRVYATDRDPDPTSSWTELDVRVAGGSDSPSADVTVVPVEGEAWSGVVAVLLGPRPTTLGFASDGAWEWTVMTPMDLDAYEGRQIQGMVFEHGGRLFVQGGSIGSSYSATLLRTNGMQELVLVP